MRTELGVLAVLAVLAAGTAAAGGGHYAFYRSMAAQRRQGGESRRVFGGAATSLGTFPAVCVLLDRYWSVRCTATVLASHWALTAAHCVSPHVAYVKFNSRRPAAPEGNVVAVHYLYRHPGYKVEQEDEGRGLDVTVLHHDVGLVRTRNAMKLDTAPSLQPMSSMRLYNLIELKNEEVQVLGYGRTELSALGEELFEVKLRLVLCERGAWFHCVCGVGILSEPRGGPAARGVCSGDSGGPVLFRGAQVGVTSMGPVECSSGRTDPPDTATSVFTSLYLYADLVNATILDTDTALRMSMIGSAAALRPLVLVRALALVLCAR